MFIAKKRKVCACTIRSVIARSERDEEIHFSVAPWIASLALAMTAQPDFAVIAYGPTTSVIFILTPIFVGSIARLDPGVAHRERSERRAGWRATSVSENPTRLALGQLPGERASFVSTPSMGGKKEERASEDARSGAGRAGSEA